MRRFSNMTIAALVVGLVGHGSLFSQPAKAQDLVPERRLVVTQDTDFPGSDLQPLFDTTFEACQTTCLANDSCQAFTFNTRSRACFPKSAVQDRIPFAGATSAEVVKTDPSLRQTATDRAGDLGWLGTQTLSKARDLALEIGVLHPAGGFDLDQILQAALDRSNAGDDANAAYWIGAAVSVVDRSDLWVEYARLTARLTAQRYDQQMRLRERAVGAAINGYLRATSTAQQVSALEVMAQQLEAAERGRDMIPALRLAQSIAPRADLDALLEEATGKYGFRIVGNSTESDSATPRICAQFSESLIKAGQDYTPFVGLPDATLSVSAADNQLCIDGVRHGERYRVVLRAGLPAASGEALLRDVELVLYVRDRSPGIVFPGRAYVLPRSADAALPVQTVNLDKIDLTLYRISDRNLLRAMQDNFFGTTLPEWQSRNFAGDIAEKVWTGQGETGNTLNRDMITRLPLGEVLSDVSAGIYALTAKVPGADPYDDPGATQWFVLSDLGLSTMSGTDGLHVMVRQLSNATALDGAQVTLLSRANAVIAEGVTDDQGYLLFDAGLTRGNGAAAPALIVVKHDADNNAAQDIAFLSLTDPSFDLSDRGVEGRTPAPPIDVFLATDRGAYRVGETIHATALTRDDKAGAISGLPVTAILTRPDGVEYSRALSTEELAGGHIFALPLGNSVPRGAWRLDIKADVDAAPLASRTVLVEDFLPERIDFEARLPDGALRTGDIPPLSVTARYLFGAPAADLAIEGEVQLRGTDRIDTFPMYRFGRHDEPVSPRSRALEPARTDADGSATLPLILPQTQSAGSPLEARVTLRVSEASNRPVERELTRALAPDTPMIGIRPLFDDILPEGSQARFRVIGLAPDLAPAPLRVRWTVNRIETRYQWYQQDGSWQWEPVTNRTRIATDAATLGTEPLEIATAVDWGRFELIVETLDSAYAASSIGFDAGWYAPADTATTPDMLELSLDKANYRSGETAMLRIVPRHAGIASIAVMANRLIDMQTVTVTEGENLIPLTVTDEWGVGAYVTATVIRPMDVAAGQMPARALGLAHAAIGPADKQLQVSIAAPEAADPRGPLDLSVQVDGIAEGETAHITLAAVDLGILNLTGFQSPDPSAHYFGQRRLGMELRDVYGRLIDGMDGAMGQVRSGGDAGSQMRLQSPPPTEELLAFFSGPITVGADGLAQIGFDLPSFNGTVRLMAMAWSPHAVGQAEADVLVRDPVVVAASLPRFLAPGDSSRLLLELTHAEGPVGRMGLDITADGITLEGTVPSGVTLAQGEQQSLVVPIRADEPGDHSIRVALTTADGRQLVKTLVLPVRANDPETSVTSRLTLAPSESLDLSSASFAGFQSGTGSVTLAAGPLSRLNAPALLAMLDRYPYGCTEQLASQTMPLLSMQDMVERLGLGDRDRINDRIASSIDRILTRQSGNGGFGLWQAGSGDFWLDAFVTDFLSRARAGGHTVPDTAFRLAIDNLRNRINYAPDFDSGGEDLAYALMVLAREGAANMGDLRYYADQKADALATPLAAAQLGAALALYGDQTRADRLFVRAAGMIEAQSGVETPVWRADFGTSLRDTAGVLALAAEAGSNAVDMSILAQQIAAANRPLSPQEASWSLLAAHALVRDGNLTGLEVNGLPLDGPVLRSTDTALALAPVNLRNVSDAPVDVTLTTYGAPEGATTASGYGYQIARSYYTLDGAPVAADQVTVGSRMVVVLTVSPSDRSGARLMVNDPLPSGFEIDNPNLLNAGDIAALEWLNPAYAEHAEFRSDRFLAAVDWQSDQPFTLAYIVRAISPGEFHHPAALVEDMYRPEYRANTASGRVVVTD
ncbi:MAG: alpha-2-macroglobulin family protein [Paracoccaceae bacterium]